MSLRNYHAFIKQVKKEFGTTHKEAQQTYRETKTALDRQPKGVDVKRNREQVGKIASGVKEEARKSEPDEYEDYDERDYEEWAITFEY